MKKQVIIQIGIDVLVIGRSCLDYIAIVNHFPHVAVPEVNAVDTIGAGDNFHAAFALGLAKNFDLHQCVKFSVAVASLSCREYGGRKGIPDMTQALEVANKLTYFHL